MASLDTSVSHCGRAWEGLRLAAMSKICSSKRRGVIRRDEEGP